MVILMEMADLSIVTVIIMKVNGKMIAVMEREFISIKMDTLTREVGKMTNFTAKELKKQVTDQHTSADLSKVRKKVMENKHLQTELITKEIIITAVLKVKDIIRMKMLYMTVSLKIVLNMEKEFINGKMDSLMKDLM